LDSIASNTQITTELQLHSDIQLTLSNLQDGHAEYVPKCFGQFFFILPWVVSLKYQDKGAAPQVVLRGTFVEQSGYFEGARTASVGKVLNEFFEKNLKVGGSSSGASSGSLKKYVGYTVTKIDGVDALQALQNFADIFSSLSKDPSARLNSVLPGYAWAVNHTTNTPSLSLIDGRYYFRNRVAPGQKDTITMELKGGSNSETVTVVVPWAAMPASRAVSQSLVNKETFYKTYCAFEGQDVPVTPPTTNSNSTTVKKSFWAGLYDNSNKNGEKTRRAEQQQQQQHRFSNSMESSPNPRFQETIFEPYMPSTVNPSVSWTSTSPPPDLSTIRLNVGSNLNSFYEGSVHLDLSKPVQSDANGAFFMLDATTGIWILQTLAPADATPEGYAAWIETTVRGLRRLEYLGATQLIVDVTRNGGGAVCETQALMSYLFEKQAKALQAAAAAVGGDSAGVYGKNGIQQLVYDLKLTPELEKAAKSAAGLKRSETEGLNIFSVDWMDGLDGKDFTKAEDLVSPGREVSRGYVNSTSHANVTSSTVKTRLTNLFQAGQCDFERNNITLPEKFNQLETGWGPDDLVILSNGACGSACASFVRILRDQFGVRAFTYGGATGKSFQPSAFEGGFVVRWDRLYNAYHEIVSSSSSGGGVTGGPLKPVFNVAGSVLFWESYSLFGEYPNVPVEWVPSAADGHVYASDPMDKVEVWTNAAKMAFSGYVGRAKEVGLMKQVASGSSSSAGSRVGYSSGEKVTGGGRMSSLMGVLVGGVFALAGMVMVVV
jgi:hypothetical protein